MSLRPNLARFLASLCRRGDDIPYRWRSRLRRRRLRPPWSPMTHGDSEYSNQWTTNRNFASTIVSRNSRAHIREPQTLDFVDDDEKSEEKRKGGFLADLQETIHVLARIAIITSVITTLLAAYLITRLTHAGSFPIILRKGKQNVNSILSRVPAELNRI